MILLTRMLVLKLQELRQPGVIQHTLLKSWVLESLSPSLGVSADPFVPVDRGSASLHPQISSPPAFTLTDSTQIHSILTSPGTATNHRPPDSLDSYPHKPFDSENEQVHAATYYRSMEEMPVDPSWLALLDHHDRDKFTLRIAEDSLQLRPFVLTLKGREAADMATLIHEVSGLLEWTLRCAKTSKSAKGLPIHLRSRPL